MFDPVVPAVQRAFYYQRAFTEIDAEHAQGPWMHPSDAALVPSGVVKGWHGAGDFSLYSSLTNSALFWLLSPSPISLPGRTTPASPNPGTACPTCWMRRDGAVVAAVRPGAGGGFRNTTCQEHYGPYGTNWPDRVASDRLGEVGTIATGRAVGTLAFASVLNRPHDIGFTQRLLEAARAGYRFLGERPV